MVIFDPEFDSVDPTSVLRGEASIDNPVASWSSGRFKSQSLVWSAWPGVIWFHLSVVERMLRDGIQGFSTYSASLLGKNGKVINGYMGWIVSGRCDPINYERSHEFVTDLGGGETTELRGLFFDEQSWDGSDVFMCRDNTAHVFFSERARRCLEPAVSNTSFEELSQVVTPTFLTKRK